MNTDTFRRDLKLAMEQAHLSQSALSRQSGIRQSDISKFLRGGREMKLSNALKLWPFIYGNFPASRQIGTDVA